MLQTTTSISPTAAATTTTITTIPKPFRPKNLQVLKLIDCNAAVYNEYFAHDAFDLREIIIFGNAEKYYIHFYKSLEIILLHDITVKRLVNVGNFNPENLKNLSLQYVLFDAAIINEFKYLMTKMTKLRELRLILPNHNNILSEELFQLEHLKIIVLKYTDELKQFRSVDLSCYKLKEFHISHLSFYFSTWIIKDTNQFYCYKLSNFIDPFFKQEKQTLNNVNKITSSLSDNRILNNFILNGLKTLDIICSVDNVLNNNYKATVENLIIRNVQYKNLNKKGKYSGFSPQSYVNDSNGADSLKANYPNIKTIQLDFFNMTHKSIKKKFT